MPKQLNVNLAFTADTREAKAQLASLQQDLNKLTQTVGSKSPLGITKDINSAIGDVNKLQAALTKATTSSGKLDLGQFKKELNAAKLNAEKISDSLIKLGPEGQTAFAKLAQSVAMAEVPIKKVNATLQQFATTLANTARWQLSSSVLHGFMGALQGAYGYAQDLNKSLNSIRVVTGQSADQMAQFAKQANESAKALSATTTAYTDASLIFFQQGLTGDAVTERTDAVIKMSNVTGDSVEDVASYMTAIWNNFDDGSQSLEHFADVITALGAATASSSAEISAGLEKFASIAGTVGLSYEYATSALATVVATTRQSADTVGTAFKTLFARLQGLKLGETLEDGVDLNKYSEALNAVGVQVLDTSGQMRALDDILDDLAARWKLLSSAQQTALAQTVAGTRQYNQLVALMSNWDFMEENLKTARDAEGSLQEQADIYAESWEAASKRVKAAWQEIYAQLLDDKFFINLTNGFGKVLDEVSNVIDALGGLKNIVPILSTTLLGLFGKQLSDSLNNFVYNLDIARHGIENVIQERQDFNHELTNIQINGLDSSQASLGNLYSQQGEVQDQLIKKTVELQNLNRTLTDQEQTIVQLYQEQVNKLTEEYQKKEALAQKGREDVTNLESNALIDAKRQDYVALGYKNQDSWNDAFFNASNNTKDLQLLLATVNEIKKVTKDGLIPEEAKESVKTLIDQVGVANNLFDNSTDKIKKLYQELSNIGSADSASDVLEQLTKEIQAVSKGTMAGNQTLSRFIEILKNTKGASKELIKDLEEVNNQHKDNASATVRSANAYVNASQGIKRYADAVKEINGSIASLSEKMVAGVRSVSSFAMALNSVSGIIDTVTNPDTSGLDKTIATLTSAGMAIGMFSSSMKGLYQTFGIADTGLTALIKKFGGLTAAIHLHKTTGIGLNALYSKRNKEIIKSIGLLDLEDKEYKDLNADELLNRLVKNGIITQEEKESELAPRLVKARLAKASATNTETKELQKLMAAQLANPVALTIAGIAAIIAITVAFIKIQEKRIEQQKKLNDEEIERVNKLQEEADANEKLVDSYMSLYDTYTKTGEGKDQLASATDELVEKYHLEGAALAKLTGDYDALTESIRQARQAELDTLINETQNEINAADSNLHNNMYASQGAYERLLSTGSNDKLDLQQGWTRFFNNTALNHGSLYGPSGSDNIDKKARDIIERYNIDTSGGYINMDMSNPQEILATYDKLSDAYRQMNAEMTESEKSHSAAFKNIHQWLQDMKDAVEEYRTALDQLSQYKVERAFINVALDQNTSVQDLYDNINKVKESLQDSVEDIDKYIDAYLSGISEIASAYEKYKLADKIVKETEGSFKISFDKAYDLIKDFNDAQVAFLSLHLNTALLDEDLEQWIKDNKPLISSIGEQGSQLSIKGAISTLTGGGSLTKEGISDLYNDNLVAEYLGVDQNAFSIMDRAEQLQVLTNAYIENTAAIVEHKKESRDALIEQASQLAEFEDIYNNKLLEIERNIVDAEKAGTEFAYSIEQVEEALIALNEAGSLDALRDTAPRLYSIITAYQKLTGQTEADIEVSAQVIDNSKKKSESYELLQQDIANLDNTTINHVENAKKWRDAELENSKILDDIQKNYQSLQSAIDNYNKTGSWSIDNIQSLIEMDDRYVAALDFSGEQITLQTEAIEAMTIAKLEDLKASITKEYQEKMLAIAEEEEAQSALAAGAASIAAGSDFLTMGEQAIEASKGIDILNETLDKLHGRDRARREQLAKEAQQAYANRIEAINKTIADIENGNIADVMAKNSSSKGSSGSTDRKDIKEYLKEFDRLYAIKKALEDIADAISDLDKKKSYLLGKSLSEALKKENELLAEQRDLYIELLNQQADYRNELAGSLEQFGATFDYETGNLTNYLEITQAALDKYNAAVDAYNSSHDKGAFSIAEQEYNHFKEVLSAYQSLLTDMQETQNNLDDNFLQQIENNLKGFEAEIKVDLDIDEAKRKVNNFFKDINTNFKRVYKSTEDWAKLFTTTYKNAITYTQGSSSTIETDLRALQEVKDFIDNEGWNNEDSNRLFVSRDDAIAKYQELSNQLMSDAQDLYDLYEETWENYLDAIDEVKNQWDDILKGFDRVDNTLKHYEKIATMLYGGDDTSGGRNYLEQIYSAQQSNSLAVQGTLRKQIEAWQKEYDEMIAAGADENDKDLRAIKESIQDSEKELESEIENYLTIIQNRLSNSIKSIMDTANRSMTKGYGIDLVIERWNDAQDAAEGYYDEIERVYELEAMESKWEEAISKTNSLKNQQYLTSIMNEQLKNLREKTKLSEYNIGLAERQLAVYQAQIALEEARENKNAMKLVRNEQGNWAYQYVADEDDIANKEEDLRNKTYEEYEYVKNASIEATEKILELYQTAQERMSALMEEYKTADEARRAEIEEEYNYLYNYYYGENGLIVTKAAETNLIEDDLNRAGMKLLWELYEEDEDNYELMTENEKALIDNLRNHGIETYTDLITAVATGDNSLYRQLQNVCQEVTDDSRTQWEQLAKQIIEEWATNPDSVQNTVTNAYDAIMFKVSEYDLAIQVSEQVAGLAWSNITDRTHEAELATQYVESAVRSLINTTDGLSSFRGQVAAIGNEWLTVKDKIAVAAGALSQYLEMLGVASNFTIPEYNPELNPYGNGWTPTSPDINGGNGNGNNSGSDSSNQRYRLVGHDNYGHETSWLLTGNSKEDVLNQMAQRFANDRGEMGNYYQSYLNGNNSGNWDIVPVEQSYGMLRNISNNGFNWNVSSGMGYDKAVSIMASPDGYDPTLVRAAYNIIKEQVMAQSRTPISYNGGSTIQQIYNRMPSMEEDNEATAYRNYITIQQVDVNNPEDFDAFVRAIEECSTGI